MEIRVEIDGFELFSSFGVLKTQLTDYLDITYIGLLFKLLPLINLKPSTFIKGLKQNGLRIFIEISFTRSRQQPD